MMRCYPTGRIFDVNEVMYAMYDLREPVPVDFLKLDHVYTRLNKPATQHRRLQIACVAASHLGHR